jgi:5,10-methylenetetrahydromethanopterin reductase
MDSSRIALELSGEPAVPEMMEIARRAEAAGYDSVWLTETRFTRDAVTTAAAVIAATRRVRVGTAVTNPYTRGDILTAVTAASLDEMSGGRFVLGIGPGSPTVLAKQGIAFNRPLTRLRQSVDVVRRFVRGEEVQPDAVRGGPGARLDFTPPRDAIPIYLGVTGPRALALAGEIADGVILNGFVSVPYTKRAVAIVREAAAAAGRDPLAVEMAASIVVSIDSDGRAARDAVRPLVTTYLAEFPNIAREADVPEDLLAQIVARHLRDGSIAASRLVDDRIVDQLVCAGTIDEVCAALERRRDAGVELPVVSFTRSGMTRWMPQLANRE